MWVDWQEMGSMDFKVENIVYDGGICSIERSSKLTAMKPGNMNWCIICDGVRKNGHSFKSTGTSESIFMKIDKMVWESRKTCWYIFKPIESEKDANQVENRILLIHWYQITDILISHTASTEFAKMTLMRVKTIWEWFCSNQDRN